MPEGIKETKEALKAGGAIAAFMIKRLKDGVDISDGMALVSKVTGDEEFRNMLLQAAADIKKIPEEMKDLNFKETRELVDCGLDITEEILEAVNTQPAGE